MGKPHQLLCNVAFYNIFLNFCHAGIWLKHFIFFDVHLSTSFRKLSEMFTFTPEFHHLMKQFTALLFLLSISANLFGKITVIVNPPEATICYRDSFSLTTIVTGTGPFQYRWQKENIDIPGATDSLWIIFSMKEADTGVYRCIVTNGVDIDTSNDAILHMYRKMKIDTLYRYNELGCPRICKGQFKALVSGGYPPYDYNWHGGKSMDTLVIGLCPGYYILTVEDTVGCTLDSAYFVDALKIPKIDFNWLPDRDTIYISYPTITVSFSDTSYADIQNWKWNFGDSTEIPNVNPVVHTYMQASKDPYTISLSITDSNGCDTVIYKDINVKVAQLFIPNIFTPDGEGTNETFEIKVQRGGEKDFWNFDFSEIYLSNELTVYDRWGKRVYQKSNYRSGDWDGGNLADGTYYYVLYLHGMYGDERLHGIVTIFQ